MNIDMMLIWLLVVISTTMVLLGKAKWLVLKTTPKSISSEFDCDIADL